MPGNCDCHFSSYQAGAVCSLCMGTCPGQRSAPLKGFMQQGVVLWEWSTKPPGAWWRLWMFLLLGVGASQLLYIWHKADVKALMFSLFLFIWQAASGSVTNPPSVAKVAATRVHTQKEGNLIMACIHTVRVYGTALSHCRYRELAEALCPKIQFNICCQIFWEDLSDKDFKLYIRSHNLPKHCVHHSEHYIFMITSTTGCACDILQRTKDCQTTNRERLFVV